MTEYQKFDTLRAFIDHCLDADANGTGAARNDFSVTVNDEPVGPEAGQATVRVLTIFPRNFDFMAQRFAFDLTDSDSLVVNGGVELQRDFLLTQAKSEAAAARAAADLAAGTVTATLGGAQ
jgi:poly-gamma-glutamate capsule biosynthesis protein CapA/YwtB (metallophosphatase superfamily)